MASLPRAAGVAILREWQESDRDSLVAEANSLAVWRNLTHTFPHPYTQEDADEWIGHCRQQDPPRDLVIDIEGQLVGVCGIEIGTGVSQYTGEVGYWLGENHWNQGVATAAVTSFLDYIWEVFEVERLQAGVFAWNPASARVLEKNGFQREGTRRKAIFKDGELIDEWIYSLLRTEVSVQ